MVKLWITAPNDGTPPLYAFLDTLEEKQRQKIFSLLALLLQTPATAMREPYVKHFGIERYRTLYELRAKSRNLVRITFTLRERRHSVLDPFYQAAPAGYDAGAGRLAAPAGAMQGWFMLHSGAVHKILHQWRKRNMKIKLILSGILLALSALAIAFWRGRWRKV